MKEKKLYKYIGINNAEVLSELLHRKSRKITKHSGFTVKGVIDFLKDRKPYCDRLRNSVLKDLEKIDSAITENLYLQDMVKFNDPFESFFWLEEKHAKSLPIYEGLSDKDKKQVDKIYNSGGGFYPIRFTDNWENYGVSCLSANPESQLMWAHYTNSGNGVCIGYKIHDDLLQTYNKTHYTIIPTYLDDSKTEIASHAIYGSINYQEKPIALNDESLEFFKKMAQDSKEERQIFGVNFSWYDLFILHQIFSKPICWKYEDEFRILVFGRSGETPLNFFQNNEKENLINLESITLGYGITSNHPILSSLIENSIEKKSIESKEIGFRGKESFNLEPIDKPLVL